MISSTGNSLAKQAAALGKRARSRRESGLFLVEGPKMFEELPKDRVEQVFVTERFWRTRTIRGWWSRWMGKRWSL